MMQYIYIVFYSLEHLNFSIYRCQHLMIIPREKLFQQNFWMGVTHSGWQGNIHFWESMCFFPFHGLLNGLIVCEIVAYIAVILQWGLVTMCFVGVHMCWHVEFFHLQGPKSYNLNARELCIFWTGTKTHTIRGTNGIFTYVYMNGCWFLCVFM